MATGPFSIQYFRCSDGDSVVILGGDNEWRQCTVTIMFASSSFRVYLFQRPRACLTLSTDEFTARATLDYYTRTFSELITVMRTSPAQPSL